MSQPHFARRAFTLVEVLVVAAIIAVIAALLFPTLKAARERGNEAVCAGNLRQIGQAFILYVQDHGTFPVTYGTWYPLLRPYLGVDASRDVSITRPNVLRCPGNHTHEWNMKKLSYGYNPFLGNNNSVASASDRVTLRMASFTHPASVILCGDVDSRLEAPNATIGYNINGSPPGVIHRGGANICFVDGHVEWKLQADITAPAGGYTPELMQIWGMYGNY